MNISCVLFCLLFLCIAEARVRGLKVGKRIQGGKRSLMKKDHGKAGPIFGEESSPFLPLSATTFAGFDPFAEEETHSAGRAHARHRSHYSSDEYVLDIDMSQLYFGKGGKGGKGGMSKSMMGKSKGKGKMSSSKSRPSAPTPDNTHQTPQPTPEPTPAPTPAPMSSPTQQPVMPTFNLMPTSSPVVITSSPTCLNVPTSPGPDLGDFFGQPPGGGNGFQDGFQDILDDIQVPDAFQDCAR